MGGGSCVLLISSGPATDAPPRDSFEAAPSGPVAGSGAAQIPRTDAPGPARFPDERELAQKAAAAGAESQMGFERNPFPDRQMPVQGLRREPGRPFAILREEVHSRWL